MRPPSSSKPRSPTTDAIQLQGRRTRRRRSCRARRPRQGWRRRGGDCCAGRGRTARKPRSRRRRAGAGAGEPAGSGWVPRRWIDRRGSPKVLAGAPASSRVPAAVAGDARPAGDRGVAGDLGRMPEKTPRACAGCLREGRNPTFSPPRVTVLRLQDAREPSGPAPAAGHDHRHWETAVLFHLRDARSAPATVWLARSRRYGDIRKALLSAPAAADADRSLPAPASPHDWLAERRFALDEGLRRLTAARGRKPPCRTGPLTWSPTSHVSPLGGEHINLTGEYRWPAADRRAPRNA